MNVQKSFGARFGLEVSIVLSMLFFAFFYFSFCVFYFPFPFQVYFSFLKNCSQISKKLSISKNVYIFHKLFKTSRNVPVSNFVPNFLKMFTLSKYFSKVQNMFFVIFVHKFKKGSWFQFFVRLVDFLFLFFLFSIYFVIPNLLIFSFDFYFPEFQNMFEISKYVLEFNNCSFFYSIQKFQKT